MIHIDLTEGEGWRDLTIKGHAGHSKYGTDIVCAGVSAIVSMLLGYFRNLSESGKLTAYSDYEMSGDVHIHCEGGETMETAFDMAWLGLQQIALTHPKHVSVTIHLAQGE